MPRKSRDENILNILKERVGRVKGVKTDADGNIISLDISRLNLSQFPIEVVYLTNLQVLILGNNEKSSSRRKSKLKNHLTHLPPEIGQLTNLRELTLADIDLEELPPEIGYLTNLEVLILGIDEGPPFRDERTNHLTCLPPEIGQLTNLRVLHLDYNYLTCLLPEFSQLSNLQELVLSYNPLMNFPLEICQLTNLRDLHLTDTGLTELPPEIGHLINLQKLVLHDNPLSRLPPEVGELTSLQGLYVMDTQLTYLPPEIGKLTNLQELYLPSNHLVHLPPEIGKLTKLRGLDIEKNCLVQVPLEISSLTNLKRLRLRDNPDLLTPPPEIVSQGTESILNFLQELQKNSFIRYEAKLIVVGEGGTGKTSVLRSLRNEEFEPNLPTTHGVEVNSLSLPHPKLHHEQITLNTWDFGGQHIYHATHRFFLTRRSLYIAVWNARLEVEQGRLYFWLETIKTLAPDAPVLLVATHTDERAPDLNYQLYKDAYPQLVGSFNVSNKEGSGFDELKGALARHAANLRLMGQPWPPTWLEVEQQLLTLPEHHIDARTYYACCAKGDVNAAVAMGTLGNYLHDLGKILYFRDDPVLSNLIVLKPNWVTKAISRVLTDETTKKANGILSHDRLSQIWAIDDDGHTYEAYLYPVFLRLMERFDLSYQIDAEKPGSPSTQSLVPQLLPHQPPTNLPPWPKGPMIDQIHVEMRYRFGFIPAGIMSWFIVRTHRYTQNMHWREGVVLKYQDHMARVELNPMLRELRLVVWGVQPHNFFTILMNTLDLILDRFEGLYVQREIPCICHWRSGAHDPCTRFYRYEDLERRMKAGKQEVECPENYVNVSVPELLYGIHMSTNEQVIADIRRGQQQLLLEQQQIRHDTSMLPEIVRLLNEVNQRSELIWRVQLRHWNFEMQRLEIECPNTFFLTLDDSSHFNPKNWISQAYRLYLICQHPQGPHQVGEGYQLREEKEFWTKLRPWLNHLVTILKVGVPMGKALGALYDEFDVNRLKNQIALMGEITKDLYGIATLDTLSNAVTDPHLHQEYQAMGSALRALHSFLTQADPNRIWGGLNKIVTPDGNILWLCDTHRRHYEAKPLDQRFLN